MELAHAGAPWRVGWGHDSAQEVVHHPKARDAVVCVGVPFAHTRPRWIVPYGGEVTVEGTEQKLWADHR